MTTTTLPDSPIVSATTTLFNPLQTQQVPVGIPSLLVDLFNHLVGILEHFRGIGQIIIQISMLIISAMGFAPEPWMGGLFSIIIEVFAIYLTYKATAKTAKYGIVVIVLIVCLVIATALATIT